MGVVNSEPTVTKQPPDKLDPLAIRAEWMRLLGIGDDEIAELCDGEKYPANIDEEMASLNAARRLNEANKPATFPVPTPLVQYSCP